MFEVSYTGYHTKNIDGDMIFRPNGTKDYLFLLFLSPMQVQIKGIWQTANSGACFLYPPNESQHYKAEKSFFNSFVHCQSTVDFLSEYPIPTLELFYPTDIEEINWYLKKIHYENCMKSTYHQRMIDGYCHQMFASICRNHIHTEEKNLPSTELQTNFRQLRHLIISHCEEPWDIKRMCEYVALEKSQLYSYYDSFFHTSPKADLISARIDKAKYLLTNEAMSIQQVSVAAGFTNLYHFSRYFKQRCGCSPREYANHMKVDHLTNLPIS